jgi:hypothetical protein
MESSEIKKYLEALNSKLSEKDVRAEIGIVGGAAMCLAFNARASTKDVDAVFEPTKEVRLAAAEVAKDFSLSKDWINDAVKGFLSPKIKKIILWQWSHLVIWTPPADYMLAMKSISARWDTSDRDDVIFLIRHLKLKSHKEVFKIIEGFYPKSRIPPKTQFFIEEIFQEN